MRNTLKMKTCFSYFRIALLYFLLFLFFTTQGQTIDQIGYQETAQAFVYFSNNKKRIFTTNGERYNEYGLTASHYYIAFNSLVSVENLKNGKKVVVRINDRSKVKSRTIGLTYAAGKILGILSNPIQVRLEIIGKERENIYMVAIEDPYQERKLSDFLERFQPINTYNIKGIVVNPKGYGVQILSTFEIEPVFEKAQEMKRLLFRDIFIQVGWANRKKSYRLILGSFKKQKEAQFLRDFLKKAKFNPIIKPHF